MDGLWKQENTAGKVQVLEGKARRHLAGKEWFVPMSWNDHSYVTEGQTGTQNTVGSSRWAQRQYGTGRARGSESGASNSSVTLTKATSHSWTHLVPVILGPFHAQDARMSGMAGAHWTGS